MTFPAPFRPFAEYAAAYQHVAIRRLDGIIELRLHTGGGPLVWGDGPHTELGYCFGDVARDPDNRVVILTGTGDSFCRRLDQSWVGEMTPAKWDKIYRHGRLLLSALLSIEVPVVAAINGPASVHAELAVLADIVLASDDAYLQDAPHFRYGTVPGDGAHAVWPLLLGMNRGREFLLTGRRISAQEAERLGVVSEVVPRPELSERAWQVARQLADKPLLALRYSRLALTRGLRELLPGSVEYGLALEGLAAYDSWPR
ncbi:MAG TPA: enoyl-CoA hydratase/isomerase family protein [Natronosporangium sp.]